MATRIACELSGAGRIPSTLANCSAAWKTAVCYTEVASIKPSAYSCDSVELIPW